MSQNPGFSVALCSRLSSAVSIHMIQFCNTSLASPFAVGWVSGTASGCQVAHSQTLLSPEKGAKTKHQHAGCRGGWDIPEGSPCHAHLMFGGCHAPKKVLVRNAEQPDIYEKSLAEQDRLSKVICIWHFCELQPRTQPSFLLGPRNASWARGQIRSAAKHLEMPIAFSSFHDK